MEWGRGAATLVRVHPALSDLRGSLAHGRGWVASSIDRSKRLGKNLPMAAVVLVQPPGATWGVWPSDRGRRDRLVRCLACSFNSSSSSSQEFGLERHKLAQSLWLGNNTEKLLVQLLVTGQLSHRHKPGLHSSVGPKRHLHPHQPTGPGWTEPS